MRRADAGLLILQMVELYGWQGRHFSTLHCITVTLQDGIFASLKKKKGENEMKQVATLDQTCRP